MNQEKCEMEKVTITLPVDIMNFLRGLQEFADFDIQEYLEDCIASILVSDLYNSEFCTMVKVERLEVKYNLKKWLEGELRDAMWYTLPNKMERHIG